MTRPDSDPARPFRLGDLLILIAGAGVAFALMRMTPLLYENLSWLWPWRQDSDRYSLGAGSGLSSYRPSWLEQAARAAKALGMAATPPAFVCSATFLSLSLRRPRPPVAQLARRPGFAACAAVMLSLAATSSLLVVYNFINRTVEGQSPLFNPPKLLLGLWMAMPITTGVSVMASWLTLALNKIWRPEPNWIDRSCRLIGLMWPLLALTQADGLFMILGMAID